MVDSAKLCPIHHGGFAAYYSPKDDVIRMPAPSTFHSQEDYYHSLYHEMTHAVGHSSRLNREGITQQAKFGSERYSKEELIAELGAAFLSNEAGILDRVRFENSAAYLASWIAKLENDPRMIVSAASQAQRSTDFIMGIEQKESLSNLSFPRKECRSPGRARMELIRGFRGLPTGTTTRMESPTSWSGSMGRSQTTGFRCHANKECRYEFSDFSR